MQTMPPSIQPAGVQPPGDQPHALLELALQTPEAAFVLHSATQTVLGIGSQAVVAPAACAQLGAVLQQHFVQLAQTGDVGTGVTVVGALPFDPAGHAHLWTPMQTFHAGEPLESALIAGAQQGADHSAHQQLLQSLQELLVKHGMAAPPAWRLHAEPARAAYEKAVQTCVDQLLAEQHQPGGLRKVVLARTLLAQADAPIHPLWLARQLMRDSTATCFSTPLPPQAAGGRWLVGASPELLIARRGSRIASHPLAGSAARHADSAISEHNARVLQESGKDMREHRWVVQAIADLLAPLCRQLHVPDGPSLYATSTMWHLGTRMEGELKDPSPEALEATSSAALAALLHPTPAVGGYPRAAALQEIEHLEPVPRNFFAGAVGWSNARGDGSWHVSLRCAQVQGQRARLYAGAGVVADSSPQAEAAETRAKFNTMLRALGASQAAQPDSM